MFTVDGDHEDVAQGCAVGGGRQGRGRGEREHRGAPESGAMCVLKLLCLCVIPFGLHAAELLSCAWSSFFQPLAPSEHFSVAETTAVSYIIYYSHTTPRPGPSDTIQAQPTAHSDRSKRPADAEKRPHF